MASARARVVFLWHMHQPCYEPPDGGLPLMPWVRLHATRAYNDLAWLLEQHAAARMVVNFVPSLIDQLEHVVAGGSDAFRELAQRPASLLGHEDREFLAAHFFSCRQETLIDPIPRYRELLERRGDVASWSEQDLRDLQTHFNLAWMGPAARAEQPLVRQLLRQGRNFSATQLHALLRVQDQVCAGVLGRWRGLAAAGQVELTTTPYYHPILPLLIDTETALRCQPDSRLPPRFSWPRDARLHVRRALDRHEEVFGVRPAGMWPAEGSVSPEAVALLAEEGVRWLATDEGVLMRSLRPGQVREHVLYQAYRAPDAGPLMLFRDRDLSDRIGFSYAKMPAEAAVEDLLGRLRAAAQGALGRRRTAHAPVLLVALDGENPWEGYVDGGEQFLRLLCTGLEREEVLQAFLPQDLRPEEGEVLERLHSGSWIDSSYRIWIGGEVENRAWGLLGAARRALAEAESAGHPNAGAALEVLLPAEGSDWFWWFGDDFSTAQEALFDRLFRMRLRRVYELIGRPVPSDLQGPVDNRRRSEQSLAPERFGHPQGLISPTIDGRVSSFYEWSGAVELPVSGSHGSMYQGTRRLQRVFYGYDLENLYLRADLLPEGGAREPAPCLLRVSVQGDPDHELEVPVVPGGWTSPAIQQGRARIVEVSIPFNALGVAPGDTLRVRLRIETDGVTMDEVPPWGWLEVKVPDENVLSWSWTV